MNEKTAIVLGGAGDVGEGIVRCLRAEGWHTIVPSRSAGKLADVRKSTDGPGPFTSIVASIGDELGASSVAQQIASEHGPIDLVVASIGGWWSGPKLVDIPIQEWSEVLQNNLTSHLTAAKAFLPLIAEREGGQYAFINGGAARMPVPGSGAISIVAAAQEMMQKVFAAEQVKHDISIYSLMLLSLIKTRSRETAPPGSISADEVGHAINALYFNPPQTGASVEIQTIEDVLALG